MKKKTQKVRAIIVSATVSAQQRRTSLGALGGGANCGCAPCSRVPRPPPSRKRTRTEGTWSRAHLHAVADAEHRDLLLCHILEEALWQPGGALHMHRVGAARENDGPGRVRLDALLWAHGMGDGADTVASKGCGWSEGLLDRRLPTEGRRLGRAGVRHQRGCRPRLRNCCTVKLRPGAAAGRDAKGPHQACIARQQDGQHTVLPDSPSDQLYTVISAG